MESAQEKQQSEIIALKSIYADDFVECQPRAWKGAARLHEFKIKVTHPEQPAKIFFHLHTILPKTYPQNAHPTFSVHQPIRGITTEQSNKLSHAIQAELRQYIGEEMVFQIATFAQDWLGANVTPPTEAIGSLAMQMTRRAQDEERVRREKELAEAEEAAERERRRIEAFNEQMQADAKRQQQEKEKFRKRHRAKSDAAESEFPASPEDILTESFDDLVEVDGIRFNTVKLFHPKPASTDHPLGTVYKADPICDDVNLTLPLEVHALTFESAYYCSTQGKKKLKHVESELQRMCKVTHRNVCRVYAVKLLFPQSGPPRLSILMEERPTLTLFELLEDSGALRPERAMDYTEQTVKGLSALHEADLLHRGVTLHSVGLDYDWRSTSKRIKLMNCSYYVKLLDLHRSNPFGSHMYSSIGEIYRLPDGWRSKDAMESSLHYTKMRDLHAAGVNLMQMLHGMNVTNEYANVHAALARSTRVTPALGQYVQVLCFPKKSSSTRDVIASLEAIEASSPSSLDLRSPTSPISIPCIESSPETDYFPRAVRLATPPLKKERESRYKQDFLELELLGRGAFGSVVKAMNTFDGGIYAVKKIKLRNEDWNKDNKIFREVEALSRLSHRYIVRYHSTWIETSEPASAANSEDSDDDGDETEIEDTADGRLRGAITRRKASGGHNGGKSKDSEGSDPFAINMDSLTTTTTSSDTARSDGRTFPTIHFSNSGSKPGEDSDGDVSSDEMDDIVISRIRSEALEPSKVAVNDRIHQRLPKLPARTLYIQMEFVERQTLRERIDEGISEDEAWRLFRQIVEALIHMASLNILHRDIKLTNIFIDSQGNCKVGDFGLATSSLQAVEMSDPSVWTLVRTPEMTLDVGTRLYIAPEVQMPVSRKKDKEKKPRNHSKADLYSLGIVFFEMNYQFRTGAERIRVIEDLRKPSIIFPQGWDPKRTRQREIIAWLLQHDPDNRPTALELSQSSLMPFSLEEEYYKGALRMMTQPDSSHYQTTMNALFEQRASGVRAMLYDNDLDHAEYMSLNGVVRDTLASMFRLHGAIEMEPPLLMPLTDGEDEANRAVFLDRHGEIVSLANNALLPFARMAARIQLQRIKRFNIGDIYRPNPVVGHPRASKVAIFDIITNDVANGASISTAECIIIVNECLDAFPTLAQHYEIRISHSSIVDMCMNRIGAEHRSTVTDVLSQTKSTWAQKRATLLKKFLLRSTVDELERWVAEIRLDDDIEGLLARLERIAPTLREAIQPYVVQIQQVIHFASLTVSRPLYFHPLMIGAHTAYFKEGVCFEVVRRNKRSDILGVGGRYDHLISKFRPPKTKGKDEPGICSISVRFSLEKILTALAAYQAAHVKTFVKEQKSFGFWSPRRCDVYIVSYTQGHLSERLEVASLLWRHGISCDIMYESALEDGTQEDFVELCNREGMLFFLWPRPRSLRRDQSFFKIKSILKGTEFEVSRQELVPWLQQQIVEQKRIDATTSGAPVLTETTQGPVTSKDPSNNAEVQLVLPGDAKKTWKQKKQMFLDKAFDYAIQIQSAAQSGIPMVAVDVGPVTFDLLCKSPVWLTDDDAWKAVVSSFPIPNPSYANQIREAINRRRYDGARFVILFGVREERSHLMTMPS
ncbi:kinase-like domain-containing protein [Vararia minispora EC-137]|uniref:Kinase-like domain-containing protein n=1 Tax=Vararia minispora EC-137 TaxID=1314806 RepID=A0ACB8QCY4_9AGAM|nr:kinase-like domain-containing protein [Vararia minispora EC-137]